MLKLTDSLKEKYLLKASKSARVNTKKWYSADQAEHLYHVAKKLWEADGYIEPPTEFTRISEREATFRNKILGT